MKAKHEKDSLKTFRRRIKNKARKREDLNEKGKVLFRAWGRNDSG